MKNVFLVLICVVLLVRTTDAQDATSSSDHGLPFALEFGAGLGGYYGALGTRVSMSWDLLGADLGLGFGPLASGASLDIAAGISLYFRDRIKPLRPKLSLFCTRIAYTLNVMEEMTIDASGFYTARAEVLYQENFPGVTLLGGVDWSLGESGRLCLNLDLGYIYPFAGYAEIKQIKEDKVDELLTEGYMVEGTLGMNKVTALDFVDFSVGIGIALGRR